MLPLAEGITWIHVLVFLAIMGIVVVKTNHLQERWNKEGDE